MPAARIYTVQKLVQLFDPARATNRIDATALTAATIEARNRHCLSVYFYTRVEDRAMPPFASQTGFTADNRPSITSPPPTPVPSTAQKTMSCPLPALR